MPKPLLSAQEYLARERKAAFKSEFYRGEMFAMAGASWKHNLITANVASETQQQLKSGLCRVVAGDMRVKVDLTGLYTYPDVVVVCEEPQFEDNMFDTLLNPRVLTEVLSDSTEKYDRGEKFKHYRQIASLQEVILVSQEEPYVERHVRQPNGDWLMTEFRGLDTTLSFTSIAVKIPLADIYQGVKFPKDADR
ncbi:MAG TPA: Uma2 family endonuclease [Gemmataceae bacterium]|nr:Uma2 family endonuclease [Gemmataceae bacterium]